MANRKMRRFNGSEGSSVDTEFGDLEGAQNAAAARAVRDQFEENEKQGSKSAPTALVSKKQLQESGFDNLRDYMNAQKGLTRRGESSARMPTNTPAASNAPAKSTSAPSAESKSTAQKQAEYDAANAQASTPEAKEERKKQIESQAIERVTPEANLIGGGALGGIKGIAALAKSLANRGGAKLSEYAIPQIENARKMLPSQMKMIGMKNGGAVKATKMGSVKTDKPSMSSASRRGDGIAQKGKTRGRMC